MPKQARRQGRPVGAGRPPQGKRGGRAAPRGDRPSKGGRAGPQDEIRSKARPGLGERAVSHFEKAVDLLQRDRAAAAVREAETAKELAPRSGSVREVLGIALYRAARFREALRELQAYRRLTGRVDQNHLIADSHRALGSPQKALEPAREAMRGRIPEDVRAEAAIVAASALADLDRFDEALAIVNAVLTGKGGVKEADLRVWYVTADLLARAGRRDEAAALFQRILRYESDAFDVAERLAELG
jgi:tetratricopeptide (TPR) repeat protein